MRTPLCDLLTFVRVQAKVAAGALALTMAALGAGLMATTLPAYAEVMTNAYTIGAPSGAVGDVTAWPSSVGEGRADEFRGHFRPSRRFVRGQRRLSHGHAVHRFGFGPGQRRYRRRLVHPSRHGRSRREGDTTTTAAIIELSSQCSLSTGQKVEVGFTADAPSSTGTMHFDVSTSKNATPASSNSLTVAVAGPQLSAASVAFGANTTYSITDVPVAGVSSGQTTIKLTVGVTSGTEAIDFYSGAASYTVTYTPSAGTASNDTVTKVVLSSSNHIATLTLSSPVANGGVLNLTARGTNPVATGATQPNEITLEPGNGASETSNAITFGQSVTGVSVSASSRVAGTSSNYFVTFKVSVPIPTGGSIFLSEAVGQTDFGAVTGIEVSDITESWHLVSTGSTLANGLAKVPLSRAVNSGDSLAVFVVGVTNPRAGTVNDFAVWTSFDTVPADAPPYTIGASAGVNVSVSPSSAGSLATYVISDLHASAAMSAGSSAISLDAPTGTTFPSSPAEYSVQDPTTPSGSGTVTAAVTGGGTNDVTLKVPGDISAGDGLTVTILDVINPSTASSTYDIGLTGAVSGPQTAAAPFPHALITYPNGSIIKFSGQDYVLAGGHTFEITSSKFLAALQKVDRAAVVPAAAGAKAPSGTPRQGTLLFTRPVNGAATIYVVGTDGELHGLVSPTQFKHDGYDPALVVTVPSLSDLKSGAASVQWVRRATHLARVPTAP